MRSSISIEHPPMGSPLFHDERIAKVMHIPRTGGHARAASLRGAAMHGLVAIAPHNTRASMLKGPAICFIRHPVTRFLSAARRLKLEPRTLLRYHLENETGMPSVELLCRHQTWWIDRPGVELYTTEQMDWVWPILVERYEWPVNPLPPQGHPDRNESVLPLPEIDEETWEDIATVFYDDMELWHDTYDGGFRLDGA